MTIEHLLEQECAQLGRFISLLEDEQAALMQAQPTPLAQIEEEKTAVVSALNTLSEARLRAATPVSGPRNDDREIMQTWLGSQACGPRAKDLWQQLTEMAHTAQRLNALNAQLVNQHLSRTSQALSILDRQRNSAPLYGSDGQATHYTGSRIVDSA